MPHPNVFSMRPGRSATSQISTPSPRTVDSRSAASTAPPSVARWSITTARRSARFTVEVGTPYLPRMRATTSAGAYSSLFSTKKAPPRGGSTRMSA